MKLARMLGAFAVAGVVAGCLSRPTGGPPAEAPAGREVDPITGRPLAPLDDGPRHEHVRLVERDPKDEHEVKIPPHTQQELETCHAKGGGKLRVRLKRGADGKRTFELIGAKSLDPTEQRCVLDSLQRLRDDETPGALGQRPDVPATGFTSLITLEW